MSHPQSVRSALYRLAIARGVSIAGGAAAFTALMFAVYERTGHNPVWLAATLILTFGMNGLLGWFAGSLGDRFDRRVVMIVSELSGAGVFAVAAFVHSPVLLVACGFAAAVAEAPFWSASGAAIPAIVEDPAEIEHATSLVSIGAYTGIFLGPAIGGALVGPVGPNWIFAANAVSFVISAALIWSVRRRFHEDVTEAEHEEHVGLWAGLRFIAADEILRRLLVGFAIMVFFNGFVMVSDLPLATSFFGNQTSTGRAYGLMIASWGIGSIAGSVAARRLNPDIEMRWLVRMSAAFAVTLGAVGLAPGFAFVIVLIFANGIADAIALVALRSIQARRTPDVVRSRVVAAMDGAQNLSLAFGYACAGPLVALLGARRVYAMAGVGALLGTVAVWRLRHRVIETTGAMKGVQP